jgi:hypothetical protein
MPGVGRNQRVIIYRPDRTQQKAPSTIIRFANLSKSSQRRAVNFISFSLKHMIKIAGKFMQNVFSYTTHTSVSVFVKKIENNRPFD